MIQVKVSADKLRLKVNFSANDLRAAAEHGLTLMKIRIVTQSRDAYGAALPPYSRKPIKIPKAGLGSGSPKVRPRGRGSRGRWGYVKFPGGYEQFRATAGRSTKRDYLLTGTLMRRFRVRSVAGSVAMIGWNTQHAVLAAQLERINQRAGGSDAVFAWSEAEADAVAEEVADLLMEGLS